MSGKNKLLSILVFSATAGAAIGLLLAPEKGKENRRKLKAGANDLIKQFNKKIEDGKENLSRMKRKIISKTEDLKDKIKSNIKSLRDDAEKEENSLKNN